MDIEKAKILDNILRRFNGNATVYWDKLQKEFKDKDGKLTKEYFITENNIKYLLGDGVLQKDRQTTGDALCMTDKGFAIFADIDKLGYEVTFKKERKERRIRRIVFYIGIATFIILIFNTISHYTSQQTKLSVPPTVDSVYSQDRQESNTKYGQSNNNLPKRQDTIPKIQTTGDKSNNISK